MTTSDVPSEHALHAYRRSLELRLRELAGELAGDRARLDEVGDADSLVSDRKDLADLSVRMAIGDAEYARDFAEAEAVQAALARIDAGTFGTCADCEEPIDPQRLLVQPSAARCATCQARAERSAHSP